MRVLRKFNETFYPEVDQEIKKPENGNVLTKENMEDLKAVKTGKKTEAVIGDFTVSRPAELDGGYLVINVEGKHQQISLKDKSYESETHLEQKVLDIVTGKILLESKRYKRSNK